MRARTIGNMVISQSGMLRPFSPTISGTVSIGQPMTIVSGGGGATYKYVLQLDGVDNRIVTNGSLFSASDIGPSVTVVAVGPGGRSGASNALVWAGVQSVMNPFSLFRETSQTGSSWSDVSTAHALTAVVQATAGLQPTSTTINGVSALHFDGIDDIMERSGTTGGLGAAMGTTTGDLWIVVDDSVETRHANGGSPLSEPGPIANSDSRLGVCLVAGGLRGYLHTTAGYFTFPASGYLAADQLGPLLVRIWYQSGFVNISVNGGAPTSVAFTGTVDWQSAAIVRFAAEWDKGTYWPGKLGFFAISNGVMSTSNQADMTAYLGWRYGIAVEV